MRAVLLASATATTSGGRRRRSPITHGSALVAFERSKLALAPLIRSRRKYGLPRLDIPPAGRGLSFAHFQHRGGIAGIGHDRQMAQTGDNLAQEFEPLAGKIGGLGRQAGDVAARSRQAWYEAGADRIVRRREHDRDNRCHLLCCKHRPSPRYDHIDLESDELSGNLAEALGTSLRPTILDRQGATLDPAEFAQSLNKGGGP